MLKPLGLTRLLLISSALVAPALVRAQDAPAPSPADAPPEAAAQEEVEEQVDVSIPGGGDDGGAEIIVTGRRSPANLSRTAPQVVSVLSTADIARTGEGDIAGALGRVTGLSVVGNGFVYVRGLGDRYSLALLNGSPLSSPEPLKRVVPLDLFPTNIVASSLVQKSYSVNFPGEFGGGVINLTTKAIPQEKFLTISMGISGDTETTGQLGYTYYGSSTDWTGKSNGNRDTPPALASFLKSGKLVDDLSVAEQSTIVGQMFNSRNAVLQKENKTQPNGSISLSGGTSWELGSDSTLGLIATLGYSNKWRTRDTIQQSASTADLSQKENNFRRVITDNRIVVNGLLGFGFEFGDNKLRWTNLLIRDTLKQSRLGVGTRETTSPTATLMQQSTAWFDRQLFDTHIVGEFKLMDDLSFDVRAGYANSKREAPMEYSFEYFRSNIASDPYGQYFVNRLNNGQQGSATASFSDLNEDLWTGSADLSYRVIPDLRLTIGYAYADTDRITERREFLIVAPNTLPGGVDLLRPDLLLATNVVNSFGIGLRDSNTSSPVVRAQLKNHAGYGQLQWEITDKFSLNAGVRYETAKQSVAVVPVFNNPPSFVPPATNLNNNYWLPAATLTYQLTPEMQVRVNASKTIARPQFRELIFQAYFDPESNRLFRGNPLLQDSELTNAEARYEWYFDRDQRLSVAGFWKKIDKPIEVYTSTDGNSLISSYANAPEATLYGAELEVQKYFPMSGISESKFWASRRAVAILNYTYTKSKLKVGANDTVAAFPLSSTRALDFFRNGVPLTGQSDHLINVQLGLEDQDKLSQQTILITYASERVTSRSTGLQPDIMEKPGLKLDFVARQGVTLGGVEAELSFEARNILGTKYQEFQKSGTNTIFTNRYRQGTSFELGVSVKF